MTQMTQYQEYIHRSRYARWREDDGRRESWDETVDRYINYFYDRLVPRVDDDGDAFGIQMGEIREAIYGLEVMPSMRTLMTAGEALDRDNVAGFNCSYVAVDTPRVFDEIMYVLMCGTGVGFSVERQFINKLPEVAEELYDTDTVINVSDSKIGWAKAYRELISMLYAGQIPKWDVSKVRPAGARLKTFGGRASGADPLVALFNFTIEVFKGAAGRKLNSIECHDVVCKVADIVVVGGVRRSALISLSNLTDERMRHAKSGQWWEDNGQRALANNSVCYTEKPDIGIFMKEWSSLYESKSGERGIFNREAAKRSAGSSGRRDVDHEFGTNPCSEIILRSKQFCNLSEVVVRSTDSLEDLKRKVRLAAIIGTLQATLTDFRYLSAVWKRNTEEEALLGVSLTGIMDHPVMSGSEVNDALAQEWPEFLYETLQELKEVAVETNKEWSSKLGINPSTAITCVKPSGTVSQLVDSSSGIHSRHSDYYIRTVRADKKDPLAQMMVEYGVPVEDDVTKPEHNYVFSFPIAAPEGSITRHDMTAIEQLELWKVYAENWCEHKPSVTITYKDDEFMAVGAWVQENFDMCSGISFLPHTDHVYAQAPYQDCTEEEYMALKDRMPELDWEKLRDYETSDNATIKHDLACSAGVCEVVDI